ncbi:cytochrome b-c1 complex subunit 8-like [Nematolebias whitei]|uniref:cytochrome b-c1 complex subunit 8-like n=1 Tax=Nematolebias whitei TaxID=451745 RepID=UPI00189B993D|nr:cytochrome b-c1 complex subunit 8-like [Nematolebias whitei]
MGLHFGNLCKVRHVVTFSLSPFEQKAFPNFFTEACPNTWRRFRGSFIRIAPHVALFFLIYNWGNSVNKQSKRKNPADYENDE